MVHVVHCEMPDFGQRVKNKMTVMPKLIPTCYPPLCCCLYHLTDTCGRLDNRGAWTRDEDRISLYADSSSIRTTLLLWTGKKQNSTFVLCFSKIQGVLKMKLAVCW